jgi:ABC-type lipoprotein export system ATPase subunit
MVSGGQQARISLARALIKKPVFLLLDEPTSALDISSEQELIPPLLKLKETTSIIIFTHSEALKKIADVLYEIKDGVVTLIK